MKKVGIFIEVPLLQNPKKRPYRKRYLSIILKHQKIFIIDHYIEEHIYTKKIELFLRDIRQIFDLILLFKND